MQISEPTEVKNIKNNEQSDVPHHEQTFQIGSFVACVYDQSWWIGKVSQVSEEFGDYEINFMHPSGP